MKIYINTHESEPEEIKEGEFYSIYDDDWHRVQCITCDWKNRNANVFFLDRGDEDVFPMDDLQVLPQEFRLLPAQSVKLSLAYLEIFSDCEEILTFMNDLLLGNNFYVKVMSCIVHEKDLPTLSVIMILMDKESTNRIVNDLLLKEILSIVTPNNFLNFVSIIL